ncbi:MAG: hypothetical protein Q9174_002462 [Haloplaca sp. 1 TL-2023]
MDGHSKAEHVLVVAGVAATTGQAVIDLHFLCKNLPGRLHALSNEVADFERVLREVAAVCDARQADPVLDSRASGMPKMLQTATSKLEELQTIVETLSQTVIRTKVALKGALAWRRIQPKLRALQEDIKTIKCHLNLLVGTSNSHDMMRIRLDLTTITSSGSDMAKMQASFQEALNTNLVGHQAKTEDMLTRLCQQHQQETWRLGNVERQLEKLSIQLEANQLKQLGTSYGLQQRQPPSRLVKRKTQYPLPKEQDAFAVRLNRYNSCGPGCACICHVEQRSSTPSLMDRVLGQVFLGYTGLPGLTRKCDVDSCQKSQTPNMSLEYWFPLGFLWSQIVRLRLTYESNLGPSFEISTLRRVSDSAPCVAFALNGDIDGLKDLFRRGVASPRDVSSTRGYSVLRTCKFLLHAGADPDYRPIAPTDNSPRNKAHQFLLMGGLSNPDVEALRCLTQDSDFIDEQNYTLLHKIVLGLSMQDLIECLDTYPDLIDVPDIMGRTPLAWASARGDERSIVALLQHGAEVNTIDVQNSGVVGHAADRNYVTCVRLLLEAGADPNIAAPHRDKVGNALNVAARNASDPMILKSLLDFGARVDSCGVDGVTGLIHAARKDNASFATLLLDYGADVNAMSKAGQTPLTSAVTFNSHNVLQLLLDRWTGYSECPRLKGPHLLQIVALYADTQTMAILTATDHLVTSYDASYAIGDFVNRLKQRPEATEKLIKAFEDLVGIIDKGPELCKSPESLMESGLASPEMWTFSRTGTLGSDQEFSDAVESICDTIAIDALYLTDLGPSRENKIIFALNFGIVTPDGKSPQRGRLDW